jgi:hypothetical protein
MNWTTYEREDQRQCLAVADLLRDGVDTMLAMADGKNVAVVYSDPPWNPGNEKWWRRHAGVDAPRDYNELLDTWCMCVGSLQPQHVFCEQSVNDTHRRMFTSAVDRCKSWTLPLLEEWTVYYGSPGSRSCTRPNKLLHFGNERLAGDPSGMTGQSMTTHVFDALDLPQGAWVADPCMGKGMTSREAHMHRLNCLGIELSRKRLTSTVGWLVRQGYLPM